MRAPLVALGVAVAVIGAVAIAWVASSQGEPVELARVTPAVARSSTASEVALVPLSGKVKGDDGKAIGGALVCDRPAFAAPTACERTAADGSFALAVLPGFHKLEAVAPAGSRYVDVWFDGIDRPRDATLLDLRRGGRENIVIMLEAGHRVSGRVTALNGRPVADAQACFDPTDVLGEWICTRTDNEGRYSVAVRDGEYSAFFVPPDETRLIPRWWKSGEQILAADTLGVHGDIPDIDVTLVPGFLIFGRVTSANGKPVENANVCVDTPFPTGRICRPTDKGGNYSVSVRRGTFIVQFVPDPDSGVVRAWYRDTPDPTAAEPVAVLFTDVRVDGVLRSGKLLWGSVRGLDGRPLEGSTINVYSADRVCCDLVTAGATGRTGDFAMIVPPGRFLMEVFPPVSQPYLSSFYGGATRRIIEVRERDTDVLAEVALQPITLERF